MMLNRWLLEQDWCPLEPFAAAGPIAVDRRWARTGAVDDAGVPDEPCLSPRHVEGSTNSSNLMRPMAPPVGALVVPPLPGALPGSGVVGDADAAAGGLVPPQGAVMGAVSSGTRRTNRIRRTN